MAATRLWETHSTRKEKTIDLPDSRYAQPVIVEPSGFEWPPAEEAASRARSWGHFTEDDV